MTPSVVLRSAVAGTLAAACLPSVAFAAPVLRSADVRIAFTSSTSCVVTMDLTVTGAAEIDHRIQTFDGSRVDLDDVRGARRASGPRAIGRTQSLVLNPAGESYVLRYRADQSEQRPYRCPLWLPVVPTDGHPGAVTLTVDLPPATSPGTSMPAFAWTGTRGSSALAHLPSTVIATFVSAGNPRGWDVGRAMDLLAITVLAVASAIWVGWMRR